MTRDREHLLWGALALAVLLAAWGLVPRLAAERSAKTVALVADYRDLVSLARQAGEPLGTLARRVAPKGLRGVMVEELTGRDLAAGCLPLRFEPAVRFGLRVPPDRGVLALAAEGALTGRVLDDLKAKFPDLSTYASGRILYIILPLAYDELGDAGLLPDYPALEFARKEGWTALYRPLPCPGVEGDRVASFLSRLFEAWPQIRALVPAGQVLAGYPDLAPVAEAMKKANVAVAQVEFVKQIGASEFALEMAPGVLPLHSLVRDELFSRRMTRPQVTDRMVRAVFERSIRVVLLRPYDLYSGGKVAAFEEDLSSISTKLADRGYRFDWPEPFPDFGAPLTGALACGIVLVAAGWSTAARFRGREDAPLTPRGLGILGAAAVLLGLAGAILSPAAKFLGVGVAVAAATEATLMALDDRRRPLSAAALGLFVALAGGLSIASFFGYPYYMLRLATFSGVKATLLFPPLLVLFHDMKRRIHPEPLGEILRRPPLWGEAAACLALLLGVAVVALRSDNVSYVPNWEIAFRDALERFLVVRPRTKEFLFGYPCLMIARTLAESDLLPRWREVFRLGAALAFASVVNTFCHFHTRLVLTLLRIGNGWWIGILIGLFAAWAIRRYARPYGLR